MTKDKPGITRLRAMDAGPRLKSAHAVIQAVVAIPKPAPRKPRKPVEGQAAMF